MKYDPNGNILSYERNATTNNSPNLRMDSLVYNYTSGTNRLDYVSDPIPSGNHADDIDDQTSGNYFYDENGNIIYDIQDEVGYRWYTNGKCSGIWQDYIADQGWTAYTLDPFGNRVEAYTEHSITGEWDFFVCSRCTRKHYGNLYI